MTQDLKMLLPLLILVAVFAVTLWLARRYRVQARRVTPYSYALGAVCFTYIGIINESTAGKILCFCAGVVCLLSAVHAFLTRTKPGAMPDDS